MWNYILINMNMDHFFHERKKIRSRFLKDIFKAILNYSFIKTLIMLYECCLVV